MSKKKRYEYFERSNEDYSERRAKKRAMREEHKDKWRYNQEIGDEDGFQDEVDDWEGYHSR
jgi:hypothetical protein